MGLVVSYFIHCCTPHSGAFHKRNTLKTLSLLQRSCKSLYCTAQWEFTDVELLNIVCLQIMNTKKDYNDKLIALRDRKLQIIDKVIST